MKRRIVLLALASLAMGIRTFSSVVAWSRDGDAFLVQADQSGPEGGGSLAYYLITTRPAAMTRALVSSTFSPGGPTRPQTVTAAACREAATRLQAAFGDRFPGVTVQPDKCDAKERQGVVAVVKALASGKLKVEVDESTVRIVAPVEVARTWTLR
jgi:hypothetical protein